MTPAELAKRHPRLYHVTLASAEPRIMELGLLSTSRWVSLCNLPPERQHAIERLRRPKKELLLHPIYGEIAISDNSPLHEGLLAGCLDGMTTQEWLLELNRRVFFWANERDVKNLANARLNRNADRIILVFDTASLVTAHAEGVHLSPINTGSAQRQPPRRGKTTFSPLAAYSYDKWRRLRSDKKTLDIVREVTVLDAVSDAKDHLVRIDRLSASSRSFR